MSTTKAIRLKDAQKVLGNSLRRAFASGSFDPVTNDLEQLTTSETTSDNKKLVIDHILREYLTKSLLAGEGATPDALGECGVLIRFAIDGARRELCSAMLPIVLLSDMFDCITLEQCEALFSVVEENVNVWKEPLFFSSCRNNLLRICNDLLRRLSRSANTVFCGRILLFLAKFFPFSERSGLNIISEFNLDNTTVFSAEDDGSGAAGKNGTAAADEDMDVDGDAPRKDGVNIEADEKNLNIDYTLYSKFWQLQDFFRNPNQCYERLPWKTFMTYADVILNTFQSFKLDDAGGATAQTKAHPRVGGSDQYFAKYLTNQNLLQLQLSDSNFRRYILLQFLILFQYLQSEVKFKTEALRLSDDQQRWINSCEKKLYALMSETPPEGNAFAAAVKHILKREKQWNAWKNDGCQPFVPKDIAKADAGEDPEAAKKLVGTRKRKRKLGDSLQEADRQKKFLMGNIQLTKLWNLCPDNMEACSAEERDFTPTLETFFHEAIEQLDPSAGIEKAYMKVNDGQWGWRALRLLANKSPNFFTYGNNPIAKLPDYLTQMLGKLAKELDIEINLDGGDKAAGDGDADADGEENGGGDAADKAGGEPETNNGTDAAVTTVCTTEQLHKIAKNLGEKWKKLGPRLGLDADAINEFHEKKDNDADRALLMLEKWVDMEGEGATQDEIEYLLGAIKMEKAAEGVFG